MNDSHKKKKNREAEKDRRAVIRDLQEQISEYFLPPEQRKISVGELLLFGEFIHSQSGSTVHLPVSSVVVYLRIGYHAFPGLIQRLHPGWERQD